LRRFLDGVGEVWVLARLDGLEDAQRVVLCVLGLGRDLGVVLLPYGEDVEEGGGCEERVDRVAGCSQYDCLHVIAAPPTW
jgi:hypothetical protein